MSPGNGSIQVIKSSTKGGFQNWSQRNDGDKKAHGGHHMGSQSAIDHEYFSVLAPQCTAFFPNPRFFVLFGQNCPRSQSHPIRRKISASRKKQKNELDCNALINPHDQPLGLSSVWKLGHPGLDVLSLWLLGLRCTRTLLGGVQHQYMVIMSHDRES